MLNLLSLLSILSVFVNGLAFPIYEKRSDPAPLILDFSVDRNTNLTTHLARYSKRGTYPEVITDVGDISYNLNILLGSNQQVSNVMIDTGSSALWITTESYDPSDSSTSEDTGNPFSIQYADGTAESGELYLDTLSFDPSNAPTVGNFQFALIQNDELGGKGGVLGIGDRNTEATSQEYDNLPWALADSGITPKASYSLFLGRENGQGSLIFGGIDTDKYLGKLQRYPVNTASGPGLYVNVASISVDGHSFSSSQPYLLDSGTSLGFVQKNVQDYLDSVFHPTMIQQGDITYRKVSCNQPTNKYIKFNFGQNTIALSYADAITNDGNGQCLLGFTEYNNYNILGDVFLRKAYVYYDLTDLTISLAQAQYSSSSLIISA